MEIDPDKLDEKLADHMELLKFVDSDSSSGDEYRGALVKRGGPSTELSRRPKKTNAEKAMLVLEKYHDGSQLTTVVKSEKNREVAILSVPDTRVDPEKFVRILQTRFNAICGMSDKRQLCQILNTIHHNAMYKNFAFVYYMYVDEPPASITVRRLDVNGDTVTYCPLGEVDHGQILMEFMGRIEEDAVGVEHYVPNILFLIIENFSLIFFGVGFCIIECDAAKSILFVAMWRQVLETYRHCIKLSQNTLMCTYIPLDGLCLALCDGVVDAVKARCPYIINGNMRWNARFEWFATAVIDGINLQSYVRKQNMNRFGSILPRIEVMAQQAIKQELKAAQAVHECERMSKLLGATATKTSDHPVSRVTEDVMQEAAAGPARKRRSSALRAAMDASDD